MDKILVSTDIGSDIDDALSLQAMFNLGLPVEAIYTANSVDLKSSTWFFTLSKSLLDNSFCANRIFIYD